MFTFKDHFKVNGTFNRNMAVLPIVTEITTPRPDDVAQLVVLSDSHIYCAHRLAVKMVPKFKAITVANRTLVGRTYNTSFLSRVLGH